MTSLPVTGVEPYLAALQAVLVIELGKWLKRKISARHSRNTKGLRVEVQAVFCLQFGGVEEAKKTSPTNNNCPDSHRDNGSGPIRDDRG